MNKFKLTSLSCVLNMKPLFVNMYSTGIDIFTYKKLKCTYKNAPDDAKRS